MCILWPVQSINTNPNGFSEYHDCYTKHLHQLKQSLLIVIHDTAYKSVDRERSHARK